MRTAAMVLGIIGATLGVLAGLRSVPYIIGGGLSGKFLDLAELAVILLIAAAAFKGAALAKKKSTASWIILLLTGILSFLTGPEFVPAAIFLVAAAILEFVGRKEPSR